MTEKKRDPTWSVEGIRSSLLDGKSPRDAGGEDARANRPPPSGTYLPFFLRVVHTRAGAMGHVTNEWARDEYLQMASALRSDPFAIEGAAEKARNVPESVKSEIESHIEHNTIGVLDLRTRANVAETAYLRDLQAADTSPPRRGWLNPIEFWCVVWAVLCTEGAIGAIMLWRALGPATAVFTGAVLSFISLAGGGLAARVLLRPTKLAQITAVRRALQWTFATTIGLVTLSILYLGACYRAAWIEGLDGTKAEIRAKLSAPESVLLNFDVLVLVTLGIVGFFVGALETWKYYHGYRSLLRESGLANAQADAAIRAKAEDLRAFVHRTAAYGNTVLDDIEHKNMGWMRAVADHGDAAGGIDCEAKRRTDLVWMVVESIAAEYSDGYQEVRPFERTSPLTFTFNGPEIDVPEVFANARQAAIATASQVSRAVMEARARIAAYAAAAIKQIDELAGLRPTTSGRAILPKRED